MYLGLDFGTSFSKVATMYLESPRLLFNPGEYGIPSDFYYDRVSGAVVGQEALDYGQANGASNLVREVKMDIISGKSFSLDGKTFSSKDIVKEIYKALINKAVQVAGKSNIGTNIDGVVLTVPAKFGMQEKYLISEAAKSCLDSKSIPVKAILSEPVAAAIAYHQTVLEDDKYILVYDLGGGTCDVALVRSDSSSGENFTVVDSDMIRRGGKDWDAVLSKYLTLQIENKSGVRITGNAGYEEKLRRAAIQVKHDLSQPDRERAMAKVEINGDLYTVIISRATFDELTEDLLEDTLECLDNVYKRYCDDYEIDEIICVGGSSNMLQVKEAIEENFPDCEVKLFEPEHAVVYGAAAFANMKTTSRLVDKAAFSYGTETIHNYGTPEEKKVVSNIIIAGMELPAENYEYYSPLKDNQYAVAFDIYESEFTDNHYDYEGTDKTFVGTVDLILPPNSPKSLSLKCKLKLNAAGMLEVEASEPSGRRVEAEFNIAEF